MKIRDHERAILAEQHVRNIASLPDEKKRKAYGAICMKLPVLVHQAGLAPALHHVAQLSAETKREILGHLAEQLWAGNLLSTAGPDELLRHVRETNTPGLLTATREVQRCLEWYRRFAKTILKAEAGDEP